MYCDALRVKIRDEGRVHNKAVYMATGVRCPAHKEVLGLWYEQTDGAKFWMRVMTELKACGIQDVLIAVVDDLKGFPEAITAVFLDSIVQTGIVHMIRNSIRVTSWKDRKPLAQALKPIDPADDADAPPFPRVAYDEAIEILQKQGAAIEWGSDFGGGDETVLSKEFEKPIIVHRYPSAIKAFNMEPDPVRPEVALCLDVLAPEGYGEIIGGGQRTASYDLLLQRLDEHGLEKEVFDWYLDLRKYGSVLHAGFGMGIERVVAWICRLDQMRETIPFPRMLYRLRP